MDYILLQTFLTVVKVGSFSKAADELHCVQSNITSRIKRLEKHFGELLFERGRGGATLTAFGCHVELQAQRLVDAHSEAERELMNAVGRPAQYRLGSMETTAGARLPPLLKWLYEAFPETGLSLRTAPTGDLTSLVWERQLDAAFVAGPIDESRFRRVAAFHERLVIARPTKGQAKLPLLAFRSACSYRNIANQWLRMNGYIDTQVIEMGTLDGMLGCVEAGMGFAIFSESAVNMYRHFDNITIEPLGEELENVTTFLIWRNDYRNNKMHDALLEKLSDGAV